MPYTAHNPMWMCLFCGSVIPAMRAAILTLSLFMFRVHTKHNHSSFSASDLAVSTHFLCGGSNLHVGDLEAVGDAAFCKIIRTHLHLNRVARKHSNAELAHLSPEIRRHRLSILERHFEMRASNQSLDRAAHFDELFRGLVVFCHVSEGI